MWFIRTVRECSLTIGFKSKSGIFAKHVTDQSAQALCSASWLVRELSEQGELFSQDSFFVLRQFVLYLSVTRLIAVAGN